MKFTPKVMFSLLASGLISLSGLAQEMPEASPRSILQQDVGLTSFKIDYSRPALRDRAIFDDILSHGNLWRAGANKATVMSFDSPVSLGEKEIPAGSYSVFIMPHKKEWVFILNKKTDLWGTGDYDRSHDVARVGAEVKRYPESRENLTYDINHIRVESAQLSVRWGKQGIELPLKVETLEQAQKNVKKALAKASEEDRWKALRTAASFYHDYDVDAEKALDFINQSLDLQPENWYSHYLQSQILASLEQYNKAVESAENALEMGSTEAEENDSDFPYAKRIQGKIKEWKKAS